MKIITRLVLSIALLGFFPISEVSEVRAELAEQKKKKKKKSTSKKKKQAAKYYKRGMAKAKKKDYEGAIKDLKKSFKLNPSKKTKAQIGKLNKKIKTKEPSKDSLKTDQNNPTESLSSKKYPRINTAAYADELFNLTGELQSSNRDLARATRYLYDDSPKKRAININSKPFLSTADFEKEAKLNPENLYIQRQLGLHYENNGNWNKAKDIYLREISKRPQNPDAHFYLGSLYANMGEYLKARNAFEEALAIDPNHRATVDAMSLFVQTKDQRALSMEVLDISSKKAPDGPAQRLNLIRKYLVSGDFEEALLKAEDGNKKYPENVGFVQLKGEAYLKLGDKESAKQEFQRAIKLNPKELQPHVSLADLYFEQGKYVYSALSYSNAVYLTPENADYRYMQGLSYFNANEWGRAASAWEDLLHYRPNDAIVRNLLPQTYYVMAVEFNRIGNPTMGRQSFKNALSVNSNSASWLPGAMATLGKFYREKRMYKESLVAFQEVLELSPNDATAYTGIGITYWEMEEKQLARASWERSLQIKPENNDAKGWLILSVQGS